MLLTEPGGGKFTKRLILRDGYDERFGYGRMWHYPSAAEADGNLYVIYSADAENIGRGAVMSVIPLNKI